MACHELEGRVANASLGQTGEWSATVVDACRQPLDSKCLYHVPCGEFYNYQSILTLFNLDCGNEHANLDAKFVESLKVINHKQIHKNSQ